MSQSGQGAEPHPRPTGPAREGVVHPGDGSSPLLPGTTGDPVGPAPAAPWGGYQGQEQQWGGRQPGTAQQPGAYGTGQAP
ncbi:hypothetical protein ABZ630_27020, partial [Streptomyces albidoflavus]